MGLGLLLLASVCAASCSGGGGRGGGNAGGGGGQNPPTVPPPPIANRTPTAANDTLRADGTSLNTIAILANDTDPDGDRLTLTIDENPPIGTVTANADGTVSLQGLPSGFKGVTRFKYHIADPGGLTASAASAVFVGSDPFRVLFAGDASANGANEVYLANFVSTPTAVTAATEGTLRLKGFIGSENGATVAYRRADTSSGATDLSFVRTATPNTQVRVALPAGTTLTQDSNGSDQYRVSPDGQWVVFIAKDGANAQAAYVLNVATPTTVNKVNIAGALYATLLRFSSDSRYLYLLASPATDGANKSLWAVELGTANVSMFSAPNAVASADDVLDYAVASDQARILIRANRGGRVGLYFIDPSHLQTEIQVSHTLALTESLKESTLSLPPGRGGSLLGTSVAYSTQNLTVFSIYVASVSATPNPQPVTSALAPTQLLGFRPDDAAMLYTRSGQISEATTAGNQAVGPGSAAWYDSTGNIVLIKQFLPYPALAVTLRGSFGTTLPLGTAVLAAHYIDVNGFDRGVVIIGEGGTTGPAPTTARLALVNAVAPDKLIYFADFQSPLGLTSSSSQIVSN